MRVRIQVSGGGDDAQDLASLNEWCAGEPRLRGLVTPESSPPPPGKMGLASEVLIAVLGNGEAITALAASLSTWLLTRRSQVKIKVTGENGRSAELDIRSTNAEKLLRGVFDDPGEGSGDGASA